MNFTDFTIPYDINPDYRQPVAYFSMEFAIDQALKIYSGGLGFLAGSHLRSAFSLKQNFIGIGILWKYGYYDQIRDQEQKMQAAWTEKQYSFLQDTGLKFQIEVHGNPVWVQAWYLPPHIFNTAPLFLLSTDLPENDFISQTISHKMYDSNQATKLAQYILLGKGGATLLEKLNFSPETFHLNEAHGLPAAFHQLKKYDQAVDRVKSQFVFTTHTPEEAGNEKHPLQMAEEMGYFSGVPMDLVKKLGQDADAELFNHSLAALRLARKANGVSQLHGKVSNLMWGNHAEVPPIHAITNAQDVKYWADEDLEKARQAENPADFRRKKDSLKQILFEVVADQCGKLFDPKILTIVWARRFAEYKRADLLLHDMNRFEKLMTNSQYPVQIIWAGKPYPLDEGAFNTYNRLVSVSEKYPNMAVLTGYELALSRKLKNGSDVWLNNPRVPREASGTSGMTAAMNGSVNVSTDDGWIPEFAKNGINAFVAPMADFTHLSREEQDAFDQNSIYEILEKQVLPTYYDRPEDWLKIQWAAMDEVKKNFNSDRMADEYYRVMYT